MNHLEVAVQDRAAGARGRVVDAARDDVGVVTGKVVGVVHDFVLRERELDDLGPGLGALDGLVVQLLDVARAEILRLGELTLVERFDIEPFLDFSAK